MFKLSIQKYLWDLSILTWFSKFGISTDRYGAWGLLLGLLLFLDVEIDAVPLPVHIRT